MVAQPGQTMHLTIGGGGRTIIGRFEIPQSISEKGNWKWNGGSQAQTKSEPFPPYPMPVNIQAGPRDAQEKWFADFEKTDAGKAYVLARQKVLDATRHYPLDLKQDGTFVIEDVQPGTYTFIASIQQSGDGRMADNYLASGHAEFTVLGPVDPGTTKPLELPAVKMELLKYVSVGDIAPEFAVKTFDGKDVKLSDFRGKYVLLNFWATHIEPSATDMQIIKTIADAVSNDNRLVVIGLSLSVDEKIAEKYAKENGAPGIQAHLTADMRNAISNTISTRHSLYMDDRSRRERCSPSSCMAMESKLRSWRRWARM